MIREYEIQCIYNVILKVNWFVISTERKKRRNDIYIMQISTVHLSHLLFFPIKLFFLKLSFKLLSFDSTIKDSLVRFSEYGATFSQYGIIFFSLAYFTQRSASSFKLTWILFGLLFNFAVLRCSSSWLFVAFQISVIFLSVEILTSLAFWKWSSSITHHVVLALSPVNIQPNYFTNTTGVSELYTHKITEIS